MVEAFSVAYCLLVFTTLKHIKTLVSSQEGQNQALGQVWPEDSLLQPLFHILDFKFAVPFILCAHWLVPACALTRG